jgi:HlyD family secretion protein
MEISMKLSKIINMVVLLLLSQLALAAHKTTADYTPYTVAVTPNVQTYLYFQGNIAPIKESRVLSPIAGIVSKELNFNYGDVVTKGQYLLSLVPSDQENTYRTALLAYLRAKSSYSEALTKYTGQELLYKNKILARNDFMQYQNTLADQKLAVQEALYDLKAVIQKISNNKNIENDLINSLSALSVNDQQVYSALNRSFDEVQIHAAASGVALLPPKSDGDSSATALQKDSVVKLDQVLLTMGDFSGLKVNIDVNEVSINKLRVGQAAEVTGPAFPGITLPGKIATISYQARSGSFGGDLPTFPVVIAVDKLTAEQQKLIHAGMTAQVKISLPQGQQLLVPVSALTLKNDQAYVNKIVNGALVLTPVQTGATTLTDVAITQGLSAGDVIAITH